VVSILRKAGWVKIKLEWDKALNLGPKAKFIRNLENTIPMLPPGAGIYVFARRYKNTISPIYVGKASNLRTRIKTQSNNRRLMDAVRTERNGDRILLIGRVKTQPGQQLEKVLKIAEQTHIEQAMTAGFPLINIQGTRTKRHEIVITGRKSRQHPFPRLMYLAI
jgi:hypothetical protein